MMEMDCFLQRSVLRLQLLCPANIGNSNSCNKPVDKIPLMHGMYNHKVQTRAVEIQSNETPSRRRMVTWFMECSIDLICAVNLF